MIVKVKEPQPEEYERFRADHVLFTYLHLAADDKLTRFLVERGVRGVAYETVQTPTAGSRSWLRCRRSPDAWRRRRARSTWSGPRAVAAC